MSWQFLSSSGLPEMALLPEVVAAGAGAGPWQDVVGPATAFDVAAAGSGGSGVAAAAGRREEIVHGCAGNFVD